MWWRASQDDSEMAATCGLPARFRTVRCQPRARNTWDTKDSGQMRRQNSWLTNTARITSGKPIFQKMSLPMPGRQMVDSRQTEER